jgi:hypothetical protein
MANIQKEFLDYEGLTLYDQNIKGYIKDVAIYRRDRQNIITRLTDLPQAVLEQNLEKYGYSIGDYFVGPSNYTYILADYNPFKGTATPYCISENHLGIVVDTHASSKWHTGDASNVGYAGSTLHTYLSGKYQALLDPQGLRFPFNMTNECTSLCSFFLLTNNY